MDAAVDVRAPGILRWRHRLGLPHLPELSLGEGDTPVLELPHLADSVGVASLRVKLDHLCPTGSFKDRAVAAATMAAVAAGSPGLVCASSGNAAVSAAAYAARAGLPAILLTPASTPPEKLKAAGAYGALQLLTPGDYSDSHSLAIKIADQLGLTNVTTTYANPDGITGLRSVAYELAAELGDDVDAIVVPTSAGPLVHGVVNGYEDLHAAGIARLVPRVIAAQPAGCAPIVRAFQEQGEAVRAWESVDTQVSGLNDPLRGYSGDGTVTLNCIRHTNGTAVAVEDEEIITCRSQLAQHHGLDVEPAAATSVAALTPLITAGTLKPSDRVVCLLTGSGTRQPAHSTTPPITVDGPDDALQRVSHVIRR